MRRRALQAAFVSVVGLTLLCGLGSFRVWSARGAELVMRGAGDVRIAHRGPARMQITYQLPPGQTRLDLRAFLLRQGWRRVEFSNVDRQTTMTFVRTSWNRQLREVLVISLDRSRRQVDIQVGQCLRIAAWTTCI